MIEICCRSSEEASILQFFKFYFDIFNTITMKKTILVKYFEVTLLSKHILRRSKMGSMSIEGAGKAIVGNLVAKLSKETCLKFGNLEMVNRRFDIYWFLFCKKNKKCFTAIARIYTEEV